MKHNLRAGVLYVGMAYLIWGLFPLYWKLLQHVSSDEILTNRIVWSFVFMILLLAVIKKWRIFQETFKEIIQFPKKGLALFVASVLVSGNWFIYIWAVNHDRIIETSLGYYINPLVSVLLGVLVLKESLSKAQILAFILALIGVLIQTLSYGEFPWVALGVAFTFSFYSLAKKMIKVDSSVGLTLETMSITPFAILFMMILSQRGQLALFHQSLSTDLLLIGGGILTAIPLLFFAKGAQQIPLYLVGFLQYITPTMTLLLGIFVYNEPFTTNQLVSFMFIWTALFLFSLSQMKWGKAVVRKKAKNEFLA
ncbi:chloramphenicol-sensitive protein RarD [Oikeobacillus pervagus]|uniref:Chloramphenicol-sensitive protein RarD n=1 Tax=Oikeobacillus pervagus TaxID=1325931 RepID=A0AAJ1WGF7_9BACI|nr:EamA family transporter RarD [Oikeobacillus pervagus]MDQ0215012.1 chloramphenicol-sensitive protein RarD [Oikeobacillus pervagus]